MWVSLAAVLAASALADDALAPSQMDAAQLHAHLAARHGPRVALPPTPEALVAAWPALFGERFAERGTKGGMLVILHCFTSAERERFLQKWLAPNYLGRSRHVFASDRTDAAAGVLGFPDDPGERMVDFRTNGNKYLGAHRPLAAILFANDTWPGLFDWILQGDDDTKFDLGRVAKLLAPTHHPRETPVLAGRVGPRQPASVTPKCKPARDRPRPAVDCCSDLANACAVDVAGARLVSDPGFFQVRGGHLERMETCAGHTKHKDCCAVKPSPPGPRRAAGYDYTLDLSNGAEAAYSVPRSWTYGGTGYALSGGLLAAIERDDWKACVDRVICGNADQRIHTCVFNLGYSYHVVPELGVHRKTWRRAVRRTLRRLAGLPPRRRDAAATPPAALFLPAAGLGLLAARRLARR